MDVALLIIPNNSFVVIPRLARLDIDAQGSIDFELQSMFKLSADRMWKTSCISGLTL